MRYDGYLDGNKRRIKVEGKANIKVANKSLNSYDNSVSTVLAAHLANFSHTLTFEW